eukprot:572832-Pleurochrysis_carterae.AAC.1
MQLVSHNLLQRRWLVLLSLGVFLAPPVVALSHVRHSSIRRIHSGSCAPSGFLMRRDISACAMQHKDSAELVSDLSTIAEMSYRQLQAQCKLRGIAATGKAVDLRARLQEALDGSSSSSEDGPASQQEPAATFVDQLVSPNTEHDEDDFAADGGDDELSIDMELAALFGEDIADEQDEDD